MGHLVLAPRGPSAAVRGEDRVEPFDHPRLRSAGGKLQRHVIEGASEVEGSG